MPVMQFTLPDPGEGLVEAEIVTWHVKPGDAVDVNQVVLEIETAKSLVELPIPWAGTVAEVLVGEGETVEVGTPIVTIDVGGDVPEAAAPAGDVAGGDAMNGSAQHAVSEELQTAADVAPESADDASAGPAAVVEDEAGEPQQKTLVGYGPAATSSKRRARRGRDGSSGPGGVGTLAAPATRGFAKQNDVEIGDVEPGRADGVVTYGDVRAHLERGGAAPTASKTAAAPTPRHMRPDAPSTLAAPSALGAPNGVAAPAGQELSDERIPIKGVRKVTAQAMVSSAFSAPHVTEFLTVDMTRTMEFVKELSGDREFRDLKVTPLLVVAKACLIAMKREPMMNALWDEAAGEIVMRAQVNLGIATATDRGLLVPNVKDAGRFGMADLGREIGKLIDIARRGKPSPAILNGGTFTISNIGVFGVDAGTPIIKPGESGILAIGTVRPMPWVVENASGEQEIAIRQIAQLSLSFDHRIIDGDVGSRFLATVGQILENPAKAMAWL